MSLPSDDEFYVGYFPTAPVRQASFVRRTVIALLLISLAIVIVLAAAQQPFAHSVFEYGQKSEIAGRVSQHPYPMLLVPRPGDGTRAGAYSRYLLVASGKHGAQAVVAGLDGQWVRLSGALVYRGNQTMLEVVEVKGQPAPATAPGLEPVVSLGTFTLTGEIVDSKCWLGVMKPGEFKPHKACAIRCISGGLPPLFVVRDSAGPAASLILVSEKGEPVNREVLDMIAEPIRITGRVTRQGDLLTLTADPSTYQRIQ